MLGEPAQLLAAWEAAARVPPVARGAVLLHHAALVDDLDAALDLPLGRSAALAARVHAETFGAAVDGLLPCAACGQELDVVVPLREVAADEGGAEAEVGALVVRAPTTRDLLAAGGAPDPGEELLARCVRTAGGAPVAPGELTASQHAQVDAAAEALAGVAGLVLRARCPACGADASAPVDVGALLWERLADAARTLLGEVAELAAAFGWSEAEVLALTPRRRSAYLELARGAS